MMPGVEHSSFEIICNRIQDLELHEKAHTPFHHYKFDRISIFSTVDSYWWISALETLSLMESFMTQCCSFYTCIWSVVVFNKCKNQLSTEVHTSAVRRQMHLVRNVLCLIITFQVQEGKKKKRKSLLRCIIFS